MNLKRLEHLIAVAEEGSVAGAARRVHLSQPALTRSIQTLELEAGLPLCDRSTRGVILTAAGRMVVERARRILFETRCLTRDLTLVCQHEIGNVRFGLGPFPAAALLPQILHGLHTDWPGLEVMAEVNDANTLLAMLQAETLDFVVLERRTLPETADFEVRRLRPERAGFFVRPSHSLCGEIEVAPSQLREATLVSSPFPRGGHAAFRKLFGCRPGEKLPFKMQSNDLHALILLARQSDVILVAPIRAVAAELHAGDLVDLNVGDTASMEIEFAIAYLAQRTLSPAASRALTVIEAIP